MSTIQIGLQIVFMFFLLVSLHEWGHFYFAKRAGILIREFAIGFGPKLFSYKKGETTYTLRMLPIGGYVRMAGEDPELVQVKPGQTIGILLEDNKISHLYLDKLEHRMNSIQGEVETIDLERDLHVTMNVDGESVRLDVMPDAMMVARGKEMQIAPWNRQFGSKSVGKRAISIAAGPAMNFVLGFVLFLIMVVLNGAPLNVKLGEVTPDSPAAAADLRQGDIVLEINHVPLGNDLNKLYQLIRESEAQPMTWIIERNNEQLQKQVTPVENADGVPQVGIMPDYDRRNLTPIEAITGAAENTVTVTKNIFVGFRMLIFGQFTMDDLAGPIGIVQISSQFASAGISSMLLWTGLLSVYFGIFNLLPFPALDGSRLMFLGLEAIRGRPVDPTRESMVHFIGFAMLMLLVIAVTYNDIMRLIQS